MEKAFARTGKETMMEEAKPPIRLSGERIAAKSNPENRPTAMMRMEAVSMIVLDLLLRGYSTKRTLPPDASRRTL